MMRSRVSTLIAARMLFALAGGKDDDGCDGIALEVGRGGRHSTAHGHTHVLSLLSGAADRRRLLPG